ncbi:hypothetical protein [Allokutzneria sp. NRRL B-24872]|uniref:hypothetical protein n=1 Tax=Allokutzneria sp. NRRL B-24872 TaxID=1137961 RepID=UPI000A36AEA7|nr:hypothetical protein [Allokutzneria sp. NRRL B-24872]
MLLGSLPATTAGTVSKRADHGWDYAIASNYYSWEYGHESSVSVCDKEPDNSYVWGYFTTFDGEKISLRNDYWASNCASRSLRGSGKQIRSFYVCEDGDGCSATVYLDRASD